MLENYTFKCYFLHNDSAKRSVPEENVSLELVPLLRWVTILQIPNLICRLQPSAVVYQLSYLIERNLLEEAIATEEDLLTVPVCVVQLWLSLFRSFPFL